jgi:rhodanese-related sulfurtransferase
MSFNIFSEVSQNPHFPDVQDVSPEQVQKNQNQVILIDVRENDEWVGELGHISSAKLINLGSLPGKTSEVPRDKTVVLICRSGGRSARAASYLKEQGYENVYNMLGGMLLWNQKGFPVERS